MRYQKTSFKGEAGAETLEADGTLSCPHAHRFVEKTVQISLVEAVVESVASTVTGNNFPVPVDNGNALTASVGGLGDQNMTVTCAGATKTAVNAPTYNVPNNATLTIPINGADQTITWVAADFVDNTAITLAEALAYFTAKLTGIVADSDGGAPRLTTTRKGTSASIGAMTGSAAAIFAFPIGVAAGTGNIANNLTGITYAEFKTLAEAAFTNDDGVLVTASGSAARISTVNTGPDASIQFKASTLATAFDLDLDLHEGAVGTVVLDGTIDGTNWVELASVTETTLVLVPESIEQLRVVMTNWISGTVSAVLGAFDPRVGY